ncbi:MAG: methyl-accepting chemotaxis protein [bacterium]
MDPKTELNDAEGKAKRSLLSIVLLNPSLQFKFISIVFLAIIFFCIMIGFQFHYAVVKKFAVDLGYTELYKPLVDTNILMVSFFLIYSVIILVFAILISHKFVGPIYRFKKSLQIFTEGDLTHRVGLRKDDELFELKDNINAMIASIHENIVTDKQKIQHIIRAIESIEQQIGRTQLSNEFSQIKSDLQSINMKFKT